MSMTDIVAKIRAEVPESNGAESEAMRNEVRTALIAGAALPDGTIGALRLRVHRFIRGGWRLHAGIAANGRTGQQQLPERGRPCAQGFDHGRVAVPLLQGSDARALAERFD